MTLWLTVSIWIIFVFWSLIEVHGMYVFCTHQHIRYSKFASRVTLLWVVFSVFWFSYQFIGT